MELKSEVFRLKLLDAGFMEATQNENRFYRADTQLTAFFVNLKILHDHIYVFYGFASTAFTRLVGCENSLIEMGIREDDSCLRFYGEIRSESDAMCLQQEAEKVFRQYSGTQKDALLKLIQLRRKAFLDQITVRLKPLGFRKKGNQWRKHLTENIVLQFWADKNPYSDKYFFEVDVYSTISKRGLWCFTYRLPKLSVDKFSYKDRVFVRDDFDWQTQSSEELSTILDTALEQYLLPIQNTPISELGSKQFIWKGCICPRDCCDTCWVQKNLWEARNS